MTDLPGEWIDYFYHARTRALEKLCRGEPPGPRFLIEFTRTTPAVITDGPAGLSGSIKMVGFLPRRKYIDDMAEKAYRRAYLERPRDMRETACLLLEEFYKWELIDPLLIGGLEMGFRHSWGNIRATGRAVLLFYTPPGTSYEVRVDAEIHSDESDPYRVYLNSIHDIFHYSGKRSNYPAYVFRIREIYDNSAAPHGFGRKIYP